MVPYILCLISYGSGPPQHSVCMSGSRWGRESGPHPYPGKSQVLKGFYEGVNRGGVRGKTRGGGKFGKRGVKWGEEGAGGGG